MKSSNPPVSKTSKPSLITPEHAIYLLGNKLSMLENKFNKTTNVLETKLGNHEKAAEILRNENIKKPGTKIAKATTSAVIAADGDNSGHDEHGVAVGTKKNKPQDGTIPISSEKGIKTKKAPGTRKKRKEISQSASKSLSIVMSA
jgi:hypothetical protein